MFNQDSFIDILQQSYDVARKNSPKSDKKLEPLYNYFSKILESIWGQDFYVTQKTNIVAQYFDKQVNIVVKEVKTHNPVFYMDIDFPLSSIAKNYNNQFERFMGKVSNIQSYRGVPFTQIMINLVETPVKKLDSINKYDKLDAYNLIRYMKLIFGVKQIYSPFAMSIFVIDVNKKTQKLTKAELNNAQLDEKIIYFLKNKLSIEHLIAKIEDYKKFYDLENSL